MLSLKEPEEPPKAKSVMSVQKKKKHKKSEARRSSLEPEHLGDIAEHYQGKKDFSPKKLETKTYEKFYDKLPSTKDELASRKEVRP